MPEKKQNQGLLVASLHFLGSKICWSNLQLETIAKLNCIPLIVREITNLYLSLLDIIVCYLAYFFRRSHFSKQQKMKFIGVDFGWSSGASGLCCLVWRDRRLSILDLTTVLKVEGILAWIEERVPPQDSGSIAVDAPTIINNQTGMRLADKLTHKHFGRYHAGCYPANLGLKFAERTTGFSNSLLAKNFQHAPQIQPKSRGRYQIEVFPHPATINLFGLEKILKYKKGKIADRRKELDKLRGYITDVLPQLEPALNPACLAKIPVIANNQTGKELKAIEDMLDSLLCAYVAAHWWYWGEVKNIVLGDLDTGYIVIPQGRSTK